MCAGLASAPGMLPAGAANVTVLASWMAPCPVPCWLMVKIVGDGLDSFTVTGLLVMPNVLTVSETCEVLINSQGIWKLIWFADTKKSGALTDPITAGCAAPSTEGV